MSKNILDFIQKVGKLKRIERSGWVREGIENPESVADHSFRLAVLAMILAPQLNLNKDKLIKMALIDDLGESETGDLVKFRGSKIDLEMQSRKLELETNAISDLFSNVDNNEEYLSLFKELTEEKTQEAKIIKQLGRIEMAIQALEYEKEQDKRLDEFFESANSLVKHPLLKDLMKEIMLSRKK